MFARLSIYENVDLELTERVKLWMESSGVDPFGDLPGYRGSMTLVDRDNARLVGIGFYASAGQAERGRHDPQHDARPRPSRGSGGDPSRARHAAESIGLYEIVHRD